VAVLARAEEPAAERVALSLGAGEWFVRARVTAPELERTVRNTLTRHQTVAALRASERRARAAFEESPEARIFVDDLERCVEYNRAAASLFPLDDAPPEGVTLPSLLAPESQGLFAPLWAGRHRQREQEARLRLRRRDGAMMVCEVNVTAQVLPDVHLVVFRDVTGREEVRARLAQSERVASLATLASGLTHELNNPLQVLASARPTATTSRPSSPPRAPPPTACTAWCATSPSSPAPRARTPRPRRSTSPRPSRRPSG
jgi:PAS domain S-box-containing protein